MFQRSDSPCIEDLYEPAEEESTEVKKYPKVSATHPEDFKCTGEELSQIEKIDNTDLELSNSIQKMSDELEHLRTEKRSNTIKRKELVICDDYELTKFLYGKLGKGNHELECLIDKYEQMEQVTIHACDAVSLVGQIFTPHMHKKPRVEKKGSPSFFNDFTRVIVTFDLSERQHLIEGLNKINRTEDIPLAASEYER